MKLLDNKWGKLVLSGAALILIYKLFNNFDDVSGAFDTLIDTLFPIITGLAIAFFLSKPSEKLANVISKIRFKVIQKNALVISVILLYAAILVVLGISVKFVAPKIYRNIEELAINIPTYFQALNKFIMENDILSKFNGLEFIGDKLAEMFAPTQLNKYIGIISGIANSFMSFFLAIILSIYMIIEKEDVFAFLKKFSERFLPERTKNVIYVYGRKTVERFYSYFTGLALDAVIVGIICSLFFSVIKIPYAPLLGLLVAVGNLVPFFGPITANIIIFIITAITAGPFKALWVIIFQILFGQVDGNIIQPKILSNSTGISPLLVLIAVIIFGDLFGFLGMIIGVPLFAVIKDVVVDYVDDGKLDDVM